MSKYRASDSMEEAVLKEIRSIRELLEHIEAILEERLIGIEEPLPDEVEAIEEYESEKKKGKQKLVKLEDALKKARKG